MALIAHMIWAKVSYPKPLQKKIYRRFFSNHMCKKMKLNSNQTNYSVLVILHNIIQFHGHARNCRRKQHQSPGRLIPDLQENSLMYAYCKGDQPISLFLHAKWGALQERRDTETSATCNCHLG